MLIAAQSGNVSSNIETQSGHPLLAHICLHLSHFQAIQLTPNVSPTSPTLVPCRTPKLPPLPLSRSPSRSARRLLTLRRRSCSRRTSHIARTRTSLLRGISSKMTVLRRRCRRRRRSCNGHSSRTSWSMPFRHVQSPRS